MFVVTMATHFITGVKHELDNMTLFCEFHHV